MDVTMPRLNGLVATREVRRILPYCEVLILSQHENAEMARQAPKAGARGYVVITSQSRFQPELLLSGTARTGGTIIEANQAAVDAAGANSASLRHFGRTYFRSRK